MNQAAVALQAAVGSASLLNFAGQRGFLGAGLGDLMPPGAADLVSPGFGDFLSQR